MNRKLLYKKLFNNQPPKQKQYEALKVLATTDNKTKPLNVIASEFGYKSQTLRNLYALTLQDKLKFFIQEQTGPKQPRIKSETIKKVILMRKEGLSVDDIRSHLQVTGFETSQSTINRILTNTGFGKLPRRTDLERGITKKNSLISDRSNNLDINNLESFNIDCPIAGIFLFLPYIIESDILKIVDQCHLPASQHIGSTQAALSMLLLKLIGNERLSHIKSFDYEPSLGIFAGLNVLPKASYMGSYSCRTDEQTLNKLQQKIVTNMKSKYPEVYQSEYINLDFHSIPHFGTESKMEKVWCGARGKAMKGATTLLAQDSSSNVITYTKADILRKNEAEEIKKFVEYWRKVRTTKISETLVFDCKLTTYKVLGDLDREGIKFITLRKRNKKLLQEAYKIPDEKWQKVKLPIPKRKYQNFLVHERSVTPKDCLKPFREIIIKDHGREKPTFVITNNWDLDLIKVLEVYAKRWRIENKISEYVSFFNLNALSSPLMIRIHFDIFWTMVADTIYHLFARDIPRFEKCRAKTIFKRFINFPGRLKYDGKNFTVSIRKRAHTPIILNIPKLNKPIFVPWLKNRSLEIKWTA